ncbi:MAG: hypothetical protein LBP35_00025 [Candidatus Ancillula trichonymphae]|jgi:hypothetical protein|nr:hypothetical protein [Candidatus Ancillula trichonymphae]
MSTSRAQVPVPNSIQPDTSVSGQVGSRQTNDDLNSACPRVVGVKLENKYTDMFANMRSLTAANQAADPTSNVYYYARLGPNKLPELTQTTGLLSRIHSQIDRIRQVNNELPESASAEDLDTRRKRTVVDKFGIASSGVTVEFGCDEYENSGSGERILQYNTGFELAPESAVVEYENVGNYYCFVRGSSKINVAPLSARITISQIKASRQDKNRSKSLPKMVFSNNLLSGFYSEQVDVFDFKLELVAKHLFDLSLGITDETSSKANAGKVVDLVLNNGNLVCLNQLCTINYTPYIHEQSSAKHAENNAGTSRGRCWLTWI